jgi:Pectinacetylesterase
MKTALGLLFGSSALVALAAAAGCSSSSSSNPTAPIDGGGTDGYVADAGSDTATPDEASSDASTDPGSDAGPITGTTPETWTWVPFSDSKCRDGSPTGIAVNLNPASTKVMIYMEGGGACFNQITCGANMSTFGRTEFDTWSKRTLAGVMSRTDAANPVKDWNIVYVPYCTGDVHSGNNPAGQVPGVTGAQAFVGYANVGLYLKRLVPTFTSATQVLLTGVSAGGFGAAANYDQVAKAFGSVPVDMLDDSGPLMEDPYVASCLQQSFLTMWGLDKTIAAACGASCSLDGGSDSSSFMLAYLKHIATTYPQRKFGLMDSLDDGTITNFWGFGAANCTSFVQETADVFTAGLNDIRTQMAAQGNFGAFYFPGTAHTTLGSSSFDTRVAGTTKLSDWVTAFVGGAVTNAGP